MRSCRSLSTLIALSVPFCLPLWTHAASIRIALRDAAVEWLAAEGIKDASAHLKVLIAAEKHDQQTVAAARRDFEKAILNGKPFDPKKHFLAIALNLLRLDNFSCRVIVPDYKKAGVTAFTEDVPSVHGNGAHQSNMDVRAIPGLRDLEKVAYRFTELSATADHYELDSGEFVSKTKAIYPYETPASAQARYPPPGRGSHRPPLPALSELGQAA